MNNLRSAGYEPILGLLDEIKKAQDADALLAALAMVFVGIDTMAWLSLDSDRKDVRGEDFQEWVDLYLKANPTSAYQYKGRDVWSARCAFMHCYGSISSSHRHNDPPKVFGYLDNGVHQQAGGGLVLLSIGVFITDFGAAVQRFLTATKQDGAMRTRLENRLPKLVLMMPLVRGARK